MVRKLTVVSLFVATACSLAGAQTRPEENPDAAMRLLRDITAGPTNQIATAMFASGVRSCATRVDQISNFLTKGTRASALLFLPEREPDHSMTSVSLEVQSESTPRAYASATFSPNTAIGCSALYETVQYWNESCSAVASRHFKGAVPAGTLATEIAMYTIGPSARVFLMRASASGCVSIKKEVVK